MSAVVEQELLRAVQWARDGARVLWVCWDQRSVHRRLLDVRAIVERDPVLHGGEVVESRMQRYRCPQPFDGLIEFVNERDPRQFSAGLTDLVVDDGVLMSELARERFMSSRHWSLLSWEPRILVL